MYLCVLCECKLWKHVREKIGAVNSHSLQYVHLNTYLSHSMGEKSRHRWWSRHNQLWKPFFTKRRRIGKCSFSFKRIDFHTAPIISDKDARHSIQYNNIKMRTINTSTLCAWIAVYTHLANNLNIMLYSAVIFHRKEKPFQCQVPSMYP